MPNNPGVVLPAKRDTPGLLELRLSLALAADSAALTGLLAGALSFDCVGLLVLEGVDF